MRKIIILPTVLILCILFTLVYCSELSPNQIITEPQPDPESEEDLSNTQIAYFTGLGGINIVAGDETVNIAGSRILSSSVLRFDAFHPSWSPDGTQIAYASHASGNSDIFIISEDGSSNENISNSFANDNNPTWSPDGSKIMFISDRDENSEIYVMNTDGSNQINISNDPGTESNPTWSHDGTKIIYESENNIVVSNIETQNRNYITEDGAGYTWPSYSSDISKLLFVSDGELYVTNSDGTEKKLVYKTSSVNYPSWLSNKDRIVFRVGTSHIYNIDINGLDTLLIAEHSQFMTGITSGPTISPDGTKLIYTMSTYNQKNGSSYGNIILDINNSSKTSIPNDIDSSVPIVDLSWSPQSDRIVYSNYNVLVIWSVNDGNKVLLSDYMPYLYKPSWSPYGEFIVHSGISRYDVEIHTINSDGTQLSKLPNPLHGYHPALSPDGEQIAYVWDNNGNGDIYIASSDGSNSAQITYSSGNDEHPSWSSDGSMIAFDSDRDGNKEIYIINSNGNGLQRATNSPEDDAHPEWSPDGTLIAFDSDNVIKIIDTLNPFPIQGEYFTSGNFPTWSPEGKYIAVSRYSSNSGEGSIISVSRGDLTERTVVSTFGYVTGRFYYPSWSPKLE